VIWAHSDLGPIPEGDTRRHLRQLVLALQPPPGLRRGHGYLAFSVFHPMIEMNYWNLLAYWRRVIFRMQRASWCFSVIKINSAI
jgi:hypothetical protein